MWLSLYSPGGYYASGLAQIGNGKDFLTSPHYSPVFGGAFARGLYQMWESMGKPDEFVLAEMGAGEGEWARQILTKMQRDLPDLYKAVRYHIVEISPALIQRPRRTIGSQHRVRFVRESAIDCGLAGIEGVIYSNELPDAFPVHRLQKMNGK